MGVSDGPSQLSDVVEDNLICLGHRCREEELEQEEEGNVKERQTGHSYFDRGGRSRGY